MAPQPTPSTQPQDRRALSHLSHGLTGRVYLFSEAEEQAFAKLDLGLKKEWNPQTESETQLLELVRDDVWRLRRAATFESALFVESAEKFAASDRSTGDALADSALANAHTWRAEAKNLNLLSLYESRISRRMERNTALLRSLQAERQAMLDDATREAALLHHAAEMNGNLESFDPDAVFRARNFEFSAEEIWALIQRWVRVEQSKSMAHPLVNRRRRAA